MFPQNEPFLEELEAISSRLKRRDYAGYLSVRFSPIEQRAPLIWLFGFLMDVQQISMKVNEPLLGEIRLQWWRDQLLKLLRGESVGHPVADGLSPFFETFGEPLFKELISIVDSFRFEIQKEPIKTITELHGLLEQRFGSFLRAGLILTAAQFEKKDLICSEAGKAIGVAQLLAELDGYLHRDLMVLPQDIMSEHNLFHENFLTTEKETQSKAKVKVLDGVTDGLMVVSWDIKAQMKLVPSKHKAFLAPWLLVPSLLAASKKEREKAVPGLTQLNPLKIFFTLYFR